MNHLPETILVEIFIKINEDTIDKLYKSSLFLRNIYKDNYAYIYNNKIMNNYHPSEFYNYKIPRKVFNELMEEDSDVKLLYALIKIGSIQGVKNLLSKINFSQEEYDEANQERTSLTYIDVLVASGSLGNIEIFNLTLSMMDKSLIRESYLSVFKKIIKTGRDENYDVLTVLINLGFSDQYRPNLLNYASLFIKILESIRYRKRKNTKLLLSYSPGLFNNRLYRIIARFMVDKDDTESLDDVIRMGNLTNDHEFLNFLMGEGLRHYTRRGNINMVEKFTEILRNAGIAVPSFILKTTYAKSYIDDMVSSVGNKLSSFWGK